MNAAVKSADERLDRTISPNDGMLAGNEPHYFSVGRSAMLSINGGFGSRARRSALPGESSIFPAVTGVCSGTCAGFPKAEITACDLLEDGVDFCAATFGAIPVYSDPDPSRIKLPRNAFDLIWVGSLFTHFDAPRWTTFLSFMRTCSSPAESSFSQRMDGIHINFRASGPRFTASKKRIASDFWLGMSEPVSAMRAINRETTTESRSATPPGSAGGI